MGITQIIDPFYRSLDPQSFRKRFENGQLAWVPTPFSVGLPMVMEVERDTPEDHFASRFKIRPMVDTDFRKRSKLPIKLLNLGETEELIVSRSKLRPALVFLTAPGVFPDLSKDLKKLGKGHLEDDCLAVIPLYSIQKVDSDTGFPPIMIARIKALMYNQFFFCPKQVSALPSDSLARLDRLFFMRPIYPAFQPTGYAISDDCLLILAVMIRRLLHLGGSNEEEEAFAAFKELALETLPPEARLPAGCS